MSAMRAVKYAEGPRELHAEGVTADSFGALAEVALERLRAVGPSGVVCGPITTGGTGHQILNLEVFNATINGLQRRGERMFTQIPYEFGLRRLAHAWEETEGNTGYCMPILDEFYTRLFESGLITRGWFIPGWSSSFGSQYERKKLSSQKAIVSDLSQEDIRIFLLQEGHSGAHVEKVMSLLSSV